MFITSRPKATALDRAWPGASSCTAENTGPKYATVDAEEKNQQT